MRSRNLYTAVRETGLSTENTVVTDQIQRSSAVSVYTRIEDGQLTGDMNNDVAMPEIILIKYSLET